MEHTIDSYGICIQNENKKFVYSGYKILQRSLRTGKRRRFAYVKVLCLKDKTLPRLIYLREAGKIGKLCNVKQLLLTHFW